MLGRFELFSPAKILSGNMRIDRKATIRPRKGLLAGALNNTQLLVCFKNLRGFITRKIGVPAQGWKTPRTYHAKCRKIWEMQAVHGEFKSLGSHLGLISMLLCRTELTARRSKRTHDLAPERENRWFDIHCDQTRVRSTDTKSGRLGPAGLVTS